MQLMPSMVSMERTPEEKAEASLPYDAIKNQPDYPYGLSICFTQDELDKLNLDAEVEVGDYIHMVCMARVTSVSKTEVNGQDRCRVEMQIEAISCENEDTQDTEETEPRAGLYKRLYR